MEVEHLWGILFISLHAMVPITLAAIGETIEEAAGLFNIGLEGILLLSALTGALGAEISGSATVGLLAGLGTGALIDISLFLIGSRNPSMSVLYPLRESLSFTIVFAAPIILQLSSTSSKNFMISILCGIVTLKPEILIDFRDSTPEFNSPFGILYAIYVHSRFNSLYAALCIVGESE